MSSAIQLNPKCTRALIDFLTDRRGFPTLLSFTVIAESRTLTANNGFRATFLDNTAHQIVAKAVEPRFVSPSYLIWSPMYVHLQLIRRT